MCTTVSFLVHPYMTMPIHMGSAIMSLDVTPIMMTDTWLPVAYFFVHLSWSRSNNNCYTMTSKKTGVLELLFLEYWSILSRESS
jgi:hypothetical protein